jgi:hypothetical protein
LILFIFTGSEPPERGLALVGLSPFVLMRYALKVELRGTLRGGGVLNTFTGKITLFIFYSTSHLASPLVYGLRACLGVGRIVLAALANAYGALLMAGYTDPFLVGWGCVKPWSTTDFFLGCNKAFNEAKRTLNDITTYHIWKRRCEFQYNKGNNTPLAVVANEIWKEFTSSIWARINHIKPKCTWNLRGIMAEKALLLALLLD